MSGANPWRVGFSLALLLFLADRASKHWVVGLLEASGQKITLTPFLDIVLVWNRGISYGLLDSGSVIMQTGLVVITAGLVTACCFWLLRVQGLVLGLSLGAIIGGGAGNFVDRLVWGAVADFISLHVGGFYWYVFNLADAAIVLGALGLFWGWHHQAESPSAS